MKFACCWQRVLQEKRLSLCAHCIRDDSTLELSVVVTLSLLVATIELAAPETVFLDLSLGRPDPLAVRRARRAAPGIPLMVFGDLADKSYAARSLSEGRLTIY